MKLSRTVTSFAAAVIISGLSAQVASAAPNTAPPTSSTISTTSTASEDAQVANLAAAFSALQNLPENLQQRAPSDPDVQAWIKANVPNPANPANPGTVATPRFNFFTCGVAIAEFAVSVVLPASKLITIAREAGGFTKFARYVFDFVRKGSLPADASDELIDLLLKVSGVGSLSACL